MYHVLTVTISPTFIAMFFAFILTGSFHLLALQVILYPFLPQNAPLPRTERQLPVSTGNTPPVAKATKKPRSSKDRL